jgi:hypothetical protein
MTGISKSQVSRLCGEIDERVSAFLNRPIEGEWPYLWLDATDLKVREAGHIVSVAVIIAVAVNTDGRREVLGMAVGLSEAEVFWTGFLRSLTRRGLRGVKLVISDCHEGIKAAAAKTLQASWQRCRVHWMRNALSHVTNKDRRPMVAAMIRTVFAQGDAKAASDQWRKRCSGLHGFPQGTLDQDLLDKPDRTPQWRGQAPHRCCRYLSKRGRHSPPGRSHTLGANRRMGHPASLHDQGNRVKGIRLSRSRDRPGMGDFWPKLVFRINAFYTLFFSKPPGRTDRVS